MPLPILAPTRNFPLTGEDYALVEAALRLLEDDMHDCQDAEATEIAHQAAELRARLRAHRDRPPALAVVVPIRAAT